jgi:Arc/MetJ-type ribon-helix-helix transcriptional regulator
VDKESKMGRPKVDTEAVNLRLPRDMIEAIDDLRRLENDLPTRPEMIRRALVQWLQSAGKPTE